MSAVYYRFSEDIRSNKGLWEGKNDSKLKAFYSVKNLTFEYLSISNVYGLFRAVWNQHWRKTEGGGTENKLLGSLVKGGACLAGWSGTQAILAELLRSSPRTAVTVDLTACSQSRSRVSKDNDVKVNTTRW